MDVHFNLGITDCIRNGINHINIPVSDFDNNFAKIDIIHTSIILVYIHWHVVC